MSWRFTFCRSTISSSCNRIRFSNMVWRVKDGRPLMYKVAIRRVSILGNIEGGAVNVCLLPV